MQPQGPYPPSQQPQAPQPTGQQLPYGPATQMPQVQPHEYEFITNPQQPAKQKGLGGVNSMAMRIGIVAGGLTLLLIIFIVIKGLISGGSVTPLYIGLLQDQQEIIHLTTEAAKITDLSESNENFTVTTQLAFTSSQNETITYLKAGGVKIKPKELTKKINPTLDKQLLDAQAASSYNTAYEQAMTTQLTNYQKSLQQIYTKTKNPKAKALLNKQYDSTGLLLKQLKAEAN